MDNKEISSQEWLDIKNKVIIPMWKTTYHTMYESLKLDYDDFESMCGLALVKALPNYDPQKSNLCTFTQSVIQRKAKTDLRDIGSRDKRKTLSHSASLNYPINATSEEELISFIPEDDAVEKETEYTRQRISCFIQSLSNQQLRFLILKLLEYDTKDITDILNISRSTANEILSCLQSREISNILYRTHW